MLENNLSYKCENIKSGILIQQGSNYGCILEIETPSGLFYAPIVLTKFKDNAIRELRKML